MPTGILGWELTVTRGPDSLWVRVGDPGRSPPEADLADQLWSLLEQHFVYCLVLDLSDVKSLDRKLLGHLLALQRRIRHHVGLMRICGLSAPNQRLVESYGLNHRFPRYDDLEEAVMGSWPRNPR